GPHGPGGRGAATLRGIDERRDGSGAWHHRGRRREAISAGHSAAQGDSRSGAGVLWVIRTSLAEMVFGAPSPRALPWTTAFRPFGPRSRLAPKGRYTIAQGNALGSYWPPLQAQIWI